MGQPCVHLKLHKEHSNLNVYENEDDTDKNFEPDSDDPLISQKVTGDKNDEGVYNKGQNFQVKKWQQDKARGTYSWNPLHNVDFLT